MRYQQTIEIHQRLETVLRLIRTGKYSTPSLAESVGVSVPTISRIVAALREQGYDIRAQRTPNGWHYVLEPSLKTNTNDHPASLDRSDTHGGHKRPAKG